MKPQRSQISRGILSPVGTRRVKTGSCSAPGSRGAGAGETCSESPIFVEFVIVQLFDPPTELSLRVPVSGPRAGTCRICRQSVCRPTGTVRAQTYRDFFISPFFMARFLLQVRPLRVHMKIVRRAWHCQKAPDDAPDPFLHAMGDPSERSVSRQGNAPPGHRARDIHPRYSDTGVSNS